MGEPLNVRGMVLQATPSGDYDKRCVLLTKERGRITAFARGARRPKSTLLAAASPFVFGTFTVYEGRDAYTFAQAEVSNYFQELKADYVGTCYGCYFLEVADYYARENLDGSELLNLLYVTLRALAAGKLDRELIRCVFEMKAMALEGVYPYEAAEDPALLPDTRYALSYVLSAPLNRLYTFTLSPAVFQEFRRVQDHFNRLNLDRSFKSLEILKSMVETEGY